MIRKNIVPREVAIAPTFINDTTFPREIQRITSTEGKSSISKDNEIIKDIIQRLNAFENEIKELNFKLENYDETLKDEYLKNNIQEQRLLQVELDIQKLKDRR